MGYPAELEFVDVVFTGPPGPGTRALVQEAMDAVADEGKSDLARAALEAADKGCQFVEVEDLKGRSIALGEWVDRGDGTWALRIEVNQAKITGRS